MTKHVWTIINLNTGEVVGTNDTDIIDSEYADYEDYICIHSEGSYFNGSREPVDISTLKDPLAADDEDE